MDNIVKTLIIVVVILVAVLGVAGGFILQGYLSNSNKNATSVNQTNASTNSITNNSSSNQTSNKSTSTKSGFISSQQAIDVAEPIIGYQPNGVYSTQNVYSAQLIDGTPYGSPYYYQVSARYQNGNGWSYEPTKVDVNAKTGKMIATFQDGSPDPLVPD